MLVLMREYNTNTMVVLLLVFVVVVCGDCDFKSNKLDGGNDGVA